MLTARHIFALGLAGILTGCTSLHGISCAPMEHRWTSELIYFGTQTPDGKVSEDEWSHFLESSVTPRFPEGLTVWSAQGQWQRSDGTTIQEDSFILNLVHPGDTRSEDGLQELIAEYKHRFQQEAVLRARSVACVSI